MKLLMVIVDKKRKEDALEIIQESTQSAIFETIAHGSATVQLLEDIQVKKSEKVLLMLVLFDEIATKVVSSLKEAIFNEINIGIAFTLSLSSINKSSLYALLKEEEITLEGEK
jgi:hypothetical protein